MRREHTSLDKVLYENGLGYRKVMGEDVLLQPAGMVYLLPGEVIDGLQYFREFDVDQATHVAEYWFHEAPR